MKRFQCDRIPNRRAVLSLPFGLFAAAGLARPILGANDRVQVAIMGMGGRANDMIDAFSARSDCNIAAVCDVHREALERAAARVVKAQRRPPKTYEDVRKLLDDKDVDVLVVTAPNHWHALATIWGCQAGKDVYVEKPACHSVWEGFRMLDAARKYGRIVQVGSHGRSIAHKVRAIELLREGAIGKVYLARGLCFKPRKSIGRTPDAPVPAGLNWDLFRGPAPMRPFSQNRFKYNWHWFWDTGNGDIGNQGVHELDFARWGLNQQGWPKSVRSTGGKFAFEDDQETPNTQLATFDYGDCQLVFEVRGLPSNPEEDILIGNLFYGSDGFMAVDVNGLRIYKGHERRKVVDEPFREDKPWATGPHIASFVKALRSRDPKDLAAPLEEGVRSASFAHLANISYRTGKTLTIDPKTGASGDPEADRLMKREYRAPYTVPERV